MATLAQIKMIHGIVAKLGIPDEDYRDMLAVYNVSSSKDIRFTVENASDLIKFLVEKATASGLYKQKTDSSPMVSSKAQKKMLINMWMQVTKQKTVDESVSAFRNFVKRRWKIDTIEWLPRSSVGKIKKVLEAMGASYTTGKESNNGV